MSSEKEIREKYAAITMRLIKMSKTITTMESATSGLIASLLTDIEGSSAIFKGAFVTYCNEAKIRNGVSKDIIIKYGVYSKETAAEMACACRQFYKTDIGIGVTGTFGNIDLENADSVPGEVFFALATNEMTHMYSYNLNNFNSRYESKLEVAGIIADKLFELIDK